MINQKLGNLQGNNLKNSLSCYIKKHQVSQIRLAVSKEEFFTLKKNPSRLLINSTKNYCLKHKKNDSFQNQQLDPHYTQQQSQLQVMNSLEKSMSILLCDNDQKSASTTEQYLNDARKFSNLFKPKINNIVQLEERKSPNKKLKEIDQIKIKNSKHYRNISNTKQNIHINQYFISKKNNQSNSIAYCHIEDFILSSQPIGFGTYSCVYRAIHKKNGMICAMKILEKQKLINLNLINNLITELKVMSLLGNKSQNISKLYGFFSDRKYFYMIMEYATDGQLYKMVTNFKPHSHKHDNMQRLELIRQVCKAVECLHHNNIMHRDVKPENILLNMYNQVKLTDFGWSSILSYHSKQQLRSTTCGTPLYQAPQQILKQKYNKSVDIWALGVLSFQLLTGKIPFDINSFKDLNKIVYQQIDYSSVQHIPYAKQFISVLLQKDGNLRNRIHNTMSQHRIFNVLDQFDQERFARDIQMAKIV